ncbi:hypothetical protein GYMLUDRAFT_658579 [Collybiopsis luxurians FD-317 M1]|uniref:Uncharacterized protein n=1 Tax=Collybiopsis luxurians FD-317 M1 TaxID=944289 RepID=A0A0D0CME4_9AGAR|nr:hypothetical protein GYMLUDRAFT_658579 [Collybiopsis luxurians FD-317 M1]
MINEVFTFIYGEAKRNILRLAYLSFPYSSKAWVSHCICWLYLVVLGLLFQGWVYLLPPVLRFSGSKAELYYVSRCLLSLNYKYSFCLNSCTGYWVLLCLLMWFHLAKTWSVDAIKLSGRLSWSTRQLEWTILFRADK